MGADVNWYIKADDIILKKSQGNIPPEQKQNQGKKIGCFRFLPHVII